MRPGAAVRGQGVDPVLPVLEVVHPGQIGAEGEVVTQVVEDLELADAGPRTARSTGEHQPDEARSRPSEQVHFPSRHGLVAGPVGDGLPPATVGRSLYDVPVGHATVREQHLDLAQVVIGSTEVDGEPLPGAGTAGVPGRRRVAVDGQSGARRAAAGCRRGPGLGGDIALDRLDVRGPEGRMGRRGHHE